MTTPIGDVTISGENFDRFTAIDRSTAFVDNIFIHSGHAVSIHEDRIAAIQKARSMPTSPPREWIESQGEKGDEGGGGDRPTPPPSIDEIRDDWLDFINRFSSLGTKTFETIEEYLKWQYEHRLKHWGGE